MSTFQPRIGTKAQLATVSVTDGQFIVITDSREIYADVDGQRLQVASNPFDAESIPLVTRPAILFAIDGLVRSIPMGAEGEVLTVQNGQLAWRVAGGGSGGIAVEDTAYGVFSSLTEVSPSLSGGAPAHGLDVFEPLEVTTAPASSTDYSIFS